MAGGYKELSSETGKSVSICPESRIDKGEQSKISKSACTENGFGNGKDAFGRNLCPPKVAEKRTIECHESLKNFLDKDKPENKMQASRWKELKGDATCDGAAKKTNEVYKCKDTSKKPCCSSSSKLSNQAGCEKSDESSKKIWLCENVEKRCEEVSRKTEKSLPLVDDKFLKIPEPKMMAMKPCLPRVEESIIGNRSKICNIPANFMCPQLKKPVMTDFFCIDARNMKMNECITHYLKKDPGQVNQCSQLSKRLHTATGCFPLSNLSRTGTVPTKYRQLFRRWLPTAGVYAVVAFALTAWVTEWGAVMRRLPFHQAEEAATQDKSSQSPSTVDDET